MLQVTLLASEIFRLLLSLAALAALGILGARLIKIRLQ